MPLARSLQRRGLERLFAPKLARGASGYHHFVRLHREPKPIALDFVLRRVEPGLIDNLRHNLRRLDYPGLALRVLVPGALDAPELELARAQAPAARWERIDDPGELGERVSQVPQGAFAKAIIDCGLRLADPEWLWDGLGTLELDPRTGIVGGPILDGAGAIVSLGYVAGLDGFFGTPRPGQPPARVRGNLPYIRRNVTAAYSGLLLVRGEVFAQCGPLRSVDEDDALYGIEFSLRCLGQGALTGYTPRMAATRSAPLAHPVGSSDAALREAIRRNYAERIAADPYYSAWLARDSQRYAEVEPCAE